MNLENGEVEVGERSEVGESKLSIRGVNYQMYEGGYIFEGMELTDVAKLRHILLSKILVYHSASDITITKNESMLNDFVFNSRVGCMRLRGNLSAAENLEWVLSVENTNVSENRIVDCRDVKFPVSIKCISPNMVLTVLRPGTGIYAYGKIKISNNEITPGFASCCFCRFTVVDDPKIGEEKIVFYLESYGQKDVNTLLDEAFAIYQSGLV